MKLHTLVSISLIVCFNFVIPFKAISQKAAGWVYMYSFDGNAYDVGPNRNHGEIIGTVNPIQDRFGRTDKALNFNSSNGYIRIPFARPLNLPTANFTFTIWLYIDQYISSTLWREVQTTNYSPVFTKAEKSRTFQYRLGTTDKGFYFDGGQEGNATGVYTFNNAALTPGKWSMLSVSSNGYVMKIFLNDKIIATSNLPVSFIENQEPLIIGCDLPGKATYFSGRMDDLSIWEKFLTEEDVKQIYTVQSKHPFVPPNITIPLKTVVVVKDTLPLPKDSALVSTPDKTIVTKAKPVIFEVSKGSTIVLKHVLFEQSKAELLPGSYAELNILVETLMEYPEMIIEVSGHTDNQGSRDLNIVLSEERAVTVKKYLVDHGIEQKRISYKGYGPDQPISPNNTEENRRLNRRVEFKIIQM